MTERNVTHATFSLERTYDATPARVWGAWSTEAGKAAWFSGPHDRWTLIERSFDFREGGRETAKGRFADGVVSAFESRIYDIVENQRLVYAYEMAIDGQRISVSLATIQLAPAGKGTRLTITEQGAFLDGYDDAGSREQGTAALLEQLAAALAKETAEA
jgi:uncharacterized protein YndB with AHSA1/START domain